ncbi:N-formylglutamate amidohydrolase [soil metagenome]
MTGRASVDAFTILAPARWDQPVIFNSPHSGRHYPQAFLAVSRLDSLALRKSEDCYVDELFGFAADLGSPLLHAHFPRAFLDLNREPYELDPRMFREDLPGFANISSIRVAGGLGTIPRIVSEGDEIYRTPLSLNEALLRIETYYRPYHRTLTDMLARAESVFGQVLLIDCHSMPSTACSHVSTQSGADIVIGDRHGVACADSITATLEDILRGHGLRVLRNKPYAGGFITQNYGAPACNRHAMQIEVNRALYLEERTLAKTAGFGILRATLQKVFTEYLACLPDLWKPRSMAAE